jgi:type IV secretory pathway VirB10-like protein
MISRPLAVALLAAGCLSAAVAGSYVAGRNSTTATAVAEPALGPAAAPAQPVSETEAILEPAVTPAQVVPAPEPVEIPVVAPRIRRAAPVTRRAESTASRSVSRAPSAAAGQTSGREVEQTGQPRPVSQTAIAPPQPEAEVVRSEPRRESAAAPAAPVFEELVIPTSSVIGLEIESSISSESAAVEDRVDARVTRDVLADGRVAIPSGSRMIGAVTHVERGGKIKERARLGVRFHTLVLADGRQVDLRTDTIYREGESVSSESSKKIGGATIGGAVLGAIMGGGKGALLGGAAGAAGGTAVVMAGGRNPATLPSGTVVTARVTSPVSIEVERK